LALGWIEVTVGFKEREKGHLYTKKPGGEQEHNISSFEPAK
jgi:hypothetical protein